MPRREARAMPAAMSGTWRWFAHAVVHERRDSCDFRPRPPPGGMRNRSCVVVLVGLFGCDEPTETFVDAAPDVDAAPACAATAGPGTMHGGSVGTGGVAETWTAAASPHLLPFDTSVYAPITLEPCAVVRIAARRTISIQPAGALVAAGEA